MDAYIYLGHYFISFTVSAIAVKLSSNILYKKKFAKKNNYSNLAPIIFLYIGYSFILSVTTFMHYFYLIILWRPNDNIYDARILFAIGGLSTLFSILHPFVEIFLCAERCIIVVFPMKYSQRLKVWYSVISAVAVFVTYGLVFAKSSMLNNFPSNSATLCRMYYCIASFFPPQYSQLIKVFFSISNIFLCVLLYLLLKKFTNDSGAVARRINNTIMYMTVATFFVDLTPNIIGQIFFSITETQLYDIIGPFSITASNINNTICLWLCYRAQGCSQD